MHVPSNFLRPTVPFSVLPRLPADALLLSKTEAAIHIFHDKQAGFSLLTGVRKSQFHLASAFSTSPTQSLFRPPSGLLSRAGSDTSSALVITAARPAFNFDIDGVAFIDLSLLAPLLSSHIPPNASLS